MPLATVSRPLKRAKREKREGCGRRAYLGLKGRVHPASRGKGPWKGPDGHGHDHDLRPHADATAQRNVLAKAKFVVYASG